VKDLETYLETAIDNVQNDREVTRELLDDVMRYLSKDEQRHAQVGSVAAKYVETLQRSNEQLVKIAGLVHRQQTGDTGLSDKDKADIFDLLQEEGNG
tara:strand:- start:425 stop:715 length:291 start_codon:yes stop_codon:yes gene_type:complete